MTTKQKAVAVPPSVPLRIYLAEDSPILVRLLEELLTSMTAIAVVGKAASASAAAADIVTLAPDVVVVDIALEQSSGFDLLRQFAQPPKRPVFIVLSNFATDEYRKASMRLGADHFFDKHTQITEMLKVVARIADNRPREGSLG